MISKEVVKLHTNHERELLPGTSQKMNKTGIVNVRTASESTTPVKIAQALTISGNVAASCWLLAASW
jgi:hypothetical protein